MSDDPTFVSPVVKYLMFAFNFVFWLIGVGLFGIGVWAFLEKNIFVSEGGNLDTKNLYDIILDVSVTMMVIGFIIYVLAFAGCLGALRENVCLLKFFTIALGIIFVLELIGACLAFIFSSEAKAKVTEVIREEGIVRYRDDPDLQNLMDWIQETFGCCGVGEKGYKDWSQNMYFNCTNLNPSPESCAVPYSCCSARNELDENVINTMCGFDVQELSPIEAHKKVYTAGCIQTVLKKAEDNLFVIGIVALCLAVPQLVGVFLARLLAGQIEEQRRSWV